MKEHIEQIYHFIRQHTLIENIVADFTDSSPALTDSKLGGLPYLDASHPIPLDGQNQPMFMLAQMNCDQLPACQIPLPQRGLLQFWLACDMPADERPADLKLQNKCIRYIPTIDKNVKEEEIKSLYQKVDSEKVLAGCQALQSSSRLDFYSMNASYKYEHIFINSWNQHYPHQAIEKLSDEMRELLYDLDEQYYAPVDQHMLKIGSYPYVYSADPSPFNYASSLLSLEGFYFDEGNYLNFGPDGLAHFLIPAEDLEELNFNRVFFFWEY